MIKEILLGFLYIYYGTFFVMACWSIYTEEWCRCIVGCKRYVTACNEMVSTWKQRAGKCIKDRWDRAREYAHTLHARCYTYTHLNQEEGV